MSSTTYGVALLGFGTVGRGVFDLLDSKSLPIQQKHGANFKVKHILVRNPTNPKYSGISPELFAKDIETIVNDSAVDIVIEVMGGDEPARSYILSALKAGKDVITANKALMGQYGDEIVRKAREVSRFLGYSATITGSHQLADSIANSVMVNSLRGVFNGTSNYILTRMEAENLDFDFVLREAQREGYAEADPSADVDGYDTRNKLAILTNLAFGVFIPPEQIECSGIRSVRRKDMEFASRLGYKIKLVGETRMTDEGKLEAEVGACLVASEDLLSRASGVNNAIEVDDKFRGIQGMIAEGAGADPTSMAIFTDLVNLSKGKQLLWPDLKGKDLPKVSTRHKLSRHYYVRLEVKNRPGTLAEISRIFGRNDINIGSVNQPEASSKNSEADLWLTCGPASKSQMKKAIKEVSSLEDIADSPFYLPIIGVPREKKMAA